MRLEPHTHLGPYEILGLLGEGGMGAVYRGRDTRLGREVAIKVAAHGFDGRFQREARSISALNHPNICTLYDVGPNYLVMELVEGETLSARLRHGALPLAAALDFAAQIAGALEAAHARGIVHRDLKPGNVMIASGERVKLLDFGLAKMEQEADPDATRTLDGAVLGTPAYMSPEQVQGQPADARTDIFAFGVVLYEMLSGRRPFQAPSSAAIAIAIAREEPAPLTGIASDLAAVVAKCLRKTPTDRYARMAEVKSALEKIRHAPAATQPSIAVLPFANMSGDKDNEYFSDGLAEELLNALTRVPGLKVTARTSAFAFRGKEQDIRQIAETLGVRTILEGSVRRAGNRVRITAQLINAADGYHLWSERYDRPMDDIFAVQDEISAAIVDALKVQFTVGKTAVETKPSSMEAYHAYLKGCFHHAKQSPEDLDLAEGYLVKAIAIDPAYAPAHAMLAAVYVTRSDYGLQPAHKTVPLARAAAARAIELDDSLAAAHMVLGFIAATHDYDWSEALRRYGRTMDLHPDSTWRAFAVLYLLIPRRYDEAITVLEVALGVDPLSVFLQRQLVLALICRGSFERALEENARMRELHGDFGLTYFDPGIIYTIRGRTQDAIAVLEQGHRIAPWVPHITALLAGNHARAGNNSRAAELLARLAAPEQSFFRGMYHAVCGDFDRAWDELEAAVEARNSNAIFVNCDPIFAAFRETPRGQALLAKMNLAPTKTSSRYSPS